MTRDPAGVDRLREEVLLLMLQRHEGKLSNVTTEDAALLGEHAARLVKAALDGMGYYDRTGEVRDPRQKGS